MFKDQDIGWVHQTRSIPHKNPAQYKAGVACGVCGRWRAQARHLNPFSLQAVVVGRRNVLRSLVHVDVGRPLLPEEVFRFAHFVGVGPDHQDNIAGF